MGSMKKGDIVVGHQHNFDHPTICLSGSLRLDAINPTKINAQGVVLEFDLLSSIALNSKDDVPFNLVPKGVWHMLTALEDGTRYACAYPHRFEQACTVEPRGQQEEKPYRKTDEDGDVWVRVDPNIAEAKTGFDMAYE